MGKINIIKKVIWFVIVSLNFGIFMLARKEALNPSPSPSQNIGSLNSLYLIAIGCFIFGFLFKKYAKFENSRAAAFYKNFEKGEIVMDVMKNFVQWGFIHVSTVMGLFAVGQTHELSKFYPFWGLSLLGFILTFPKTETKTLGQ